MKLALIQNSLTLGNVDENFKLIKSELEKAIKTTPDVIVLPEMWNTSFFPKNILDLADIDGKRTQKFLSDFAIINNVNIVGGSIARKKNNTLYNTSYIFDRKGNLVNSYDKVHLFSPSGEDEVFQSGDKLCTFELDGIKCGLCICYDIRFVEWTRMNALEDIQILFIPAAWPQKRQLHWDTLNRARAIENQMYVVCVNSTGDFGGHSAIIDPWGEYVITPDTKNEIKTGVIDLSIIEDIRKNINVFRDRKKELYKL
ncbi:MAG: carbon-nitrogen family hydrolase [Peptoniphilus sp.]|uniref:carbon-nitrogen family hydrolase n=1 Tax=Peptoniphilus sp. TaxID=1971214 RepID=UPI002A74FE32|nr:carbon-nitrogen family hydrolase [Peptoniphilus sp.]MDY2987520.1 carbon-nitrogen family hydrolase [Peptoniphilus sp.]